MRLPEKVPFISKDFDFPKALEEISNLGRFREFIEIADNKYYYWDKWKYLGKEWGIDPKKLWGAAKVRRLSNKQISVSLIDGFTFQVGNPSVIQQYLHEFDLHLGGIIQGDGLIPSEDKDRYLISSLMEEAIASSQLEGAATTRKVAKEMLEKNRKPKNTSEQMILNNYEAMKWIVENKDKPITTESIKKVHSILTKLTLANPAEEGEFRQTSDVNVVDVQTGAIIYTPPDADKLEQLMNDFCLWANEPASKSFFIHPITKGVMLHFLIGYIHPFADGNGRTARTMFYWYLLKKGYWLIEYMSVSRIILNSKAQYARAYLYTEQDDNDITYFLEYNLHSIHVALEDLKKYIRRKTVEKQNTLLLLRNTSFNDRQIVMVQEIIQDANTYFTVKQIENKFGVSNQTARNDLASLVREGVLEERKQGAGYQFLPVKEYFKKLGKGR
jgi:Fic family protein